MRIKSILITLLLIATLGGLYGLFKPLPDTLDYRSPVYPISQDQIEFLTDTTSHNNGTESQQVIFDRIISLINQADNYVLLDIFLFNDQLGQADSAFRPLSSELANALVSYYQKDNQNHLTVITDPINTAYGSYYPTPLQTLRNNDVPLVITDLTVLRDSNPLYSGWYRSFLQFLPDFGLQWLPNPFDPSHPKTTLGSYVRALNFKANHRKTLLTNSLQDNQTHWHGLVTSLNPHDGSSRHGNIAVVIHDHPVLQDLYQTESAVVDFSQATKEPAPDITFREDLSQNPEMTVQLLTEQAIKHTALEMIDQTNDGDQIDLAMFYLSDRDIVRALRNADNRSVTIRILLDPNRDAFGREKNGIPNRPVAHELMQRTNGHTNIRWCATNGEQCHSKLLRTQTGDRAAVLLGSANFTRRNLDNYNLETALKVTGAIDNIWQTEVREFFQMRWENTPEHTYSTSYQTYADSSWLKTWWYRIGEFTGISHY